MNESIKLEKGIIDGITEATLEKLIKAGITTLQALSSQKTKDLAEKSGMSEQTSEKVIRKAIDMVMSGYITAAQLQDVRSLRTHLTTGCENLDNLLGGGIESETTTELIGAGAVGKTAICHTLAVLAQQPIEQKGLGGNIAWIDTESTFIPTRIKEICISRGIDPEKSLNGIFWALARNTEHQKKLIEQLYALIPENNIKLVIIDSMMGHLRAEFIGRATLNERQGDLGRMLQILLQIALSMKVTVVYTNQVVTDPSIMYGNAEKPAGGNIMSHAAGTRLHLRKGREGARVAKLIDSLSLPEGEAVFYITSKGIEGSKKKEEEQ